MCFQGWPFLNGAVYIDDQSSIELINHSAILFIFCLKLPLFKNQICQWSWYLKCIMVCIALTISSCSCLMPVQSTSKNEDKEIVLQTVCCSILSWWIFKYQLYRQSRERLYFIYSFKIYSVKRIISLKRNS